ncbi:MAG: hypothetical protein NTY35_07990, partial [Planctomycetota bacterium]|nr:hypothetical protein [Planctomycetota bacterium]
MQRIPSFLRLAGAALFLTASARADLIEQFTPAPRDCTPCVWFQVLNGGTPGTPGNSGVMNLATMPFGSTLHGGWLTFTPQGTFVTYIGGGSSTTEVRTSAGASIPDVRGAINLSEAFGVIVDPMTGTIWGATLYAGVVLWTPAHTYLLLVGGTPAIYEFTIGGAAIGGVRGGARLAANILDTDPGIGVAATQFSGTVVYTSTQAFLLTTFGLGIGASELTLGGGSIGGVRGVTAMGGDANPFLLDAGAFLWTNSKVMLLVAGGGTSVSEVLDPAGASIARAWGVTRQSPLYPGGTTFQGLATVINDTKEFLVYVGGGVTTAEVTAAGTSLTSNVLTPGSNTLLHQASGLSEVFSTWSPPGAPLMRGT